MHDAQLHLGPRIHRFDRFWESLQSIHAGDEHILHSAILQFGQHLQPELRSLVLRHPSSRSLMAKAFSSSDWLEKSVADGPLFGRLGCCFTVLAALNYFFF